MLFQGYFSYIVLISFLSVVRHSMFLVLKLLFFYFHSFIIDGVGVVLFITTMNEKSMPSQSYFHSIIEIIKEPGWSRSTPPQCYAYAIIPPCWSITVSVFRIVVVFVKNNVGFHSYFGLLCFSPVL